MNKKEIIKILDKYDFDREKIIVVSSAALVLLNIKENTNTIEIHTDENYEREIKKTYNFQNGIIDDIIYIKPASLDKDIKRNGYYVQSPEDILKIAEEEDKTNIKKYINIKNMNSLSLAYLGDAVYELYIREKLIESNMKVKELQKQSINYVSAKAQSKFLDKMLEDNFLTKEEIEIVKRARNHKSHSSKSADIITYKKSTGLEALIGYLKLTKYENRIEEIMKYIVGE